MPISVTAAVEKLPNSDWSAAYRLPRNAFVREFLRNLVNAADVFCIDNIAE